MKYSQRGQRLEVPEGVRGDGGDLVVAEISENNKVINCSQLVRGRRRRYQLLQPEMDIKGDNFKLTL